MMEPEVIKDDEYYAREIRSQIKNLSQLVEQAQKTGLNVTLSLGGLGTPNWSGYQDAAIIVRKY